MYTQLNQSINHIHYYYYTNSKQAQLHYTGESSKNAHGTVPIQLNLLKTTAIITSAGVLHIEWLKMQQQQI